MFSTVMGDSSNQQPPASKPSNPLKKGDVAGDFIVNVDSSNPTPGANNTRLMQELWVWRLTENE